MPLLTEATNPQQHPTNVIMNGEFRKRHEKTWASFEFEISTKFL